MVAACQVRMSFLRYRQSSFLLIAFHIQVASLVPRLNKLEPGNEVCMVYAIRLFQITNSLPYITV